MHLARFLSFHRYVNGKTYMEDVANALEEAREEIFITDWWLVNRDSVVCLSHVIFQDYVL